MGDDPEGKKRDILRLKACGMAFPPASLNCIKAGQPAFRPRKAILDLPERRDPDTDDIDMLYTDEDTGMEIHEETD